MLEVVLREFQILCHVPVAFNRAEPVNDANPVNRVLGGVWPAGFDEDLGDELANATDSRVADLPKLVAFGEPADFQPVGIVARIEDYRSAVKVKVVGGF